MKYLDKIFAIAIKVKTPLSITGLTIAILYLIIRQILSLDIFANVGEEKTFLFLSSVLDKIFWLAIIALFLGVSGYIFSFLFKKAKLSITVGDTSTTAKKRYQSASHLIKEELISNFITLNVLEKGIEERVPQKFWDIRKPNESEDTYQERAKNFQKVYQNGIFQLIQTFKIKEEVFKVHRKDLSFDATITDCVQNAYKWQKESYENIQSYSEILLHNMLIKDRDSELYIENIASHKEKVIKTRILLLQSISNFISAYPSDESIVLNIFQDFKFECLSGFSIKKVKINMEIKGLYLKKAEILQERINKPQRDLEIDRIINDPYLQLIRKTVGLTEELSEAEYYGLVHHKIDTETSDSLKLLQLASASYTESDGRASIYYLEKALRNENNPVKIHPGGVVQAVERLNNPDIYDGGIGLIILDMNNDSVLSEKIEIGDVICKINGEIINEPSDISSIMATTKKEEDVLFEIYNQKGKVITKAVSGRTHLGCIVTPSIMLNSFLV